MSASTAHNNNLNPNYPLQMLQAPVSFSTAVQGLLLAQKEALSVGSAAGGEHLCFVGSGREEEDQYVHMVVSSFLQRTTLKVGILSGGYQGMKREIELKSNYLFAPCVFGSCP
jgi:hypothetical protein